MNIYSNGTFTGPSDPSRNGGRTPLGPPGAVVSAAGKPRETRAPRPGAQGRLIAEVARPYHQERLSQAEIATRLRFAQGTVCRLLQRAAERGIVRVAVIPPEGTFVDLEELLERKFGLSQVIVARAVSRSEGNIESVLGAAAAHYLETTL